MSVLLVDPGSAGFEVLRDLPKLGYHGPETCELLLDEVEVGELVRQAAHAAGAGDAPVDVDPSLSGLRLRVDKV